MPDHRLHRYEVLHNKLSGLEVLPVDCNPVEIQSVFTSKIYLITDKDDILAKKNIITESDLYGRTLMVGGGSPAALKSVQQRLISSKK